jgi:outer membrane protein
LSRIYTLLLCALACVEFAWPVGARAAPTSLSLAQAQRIALAEHPNVRVAAFDVSAAEEAVKIARSGYSPQVAGSAVSAFAKPDTRIAATAFGITDPTVLARTSAGIEISQYVTDFGRTADLVRSYELGAKAQAERGEETRLTVVLNVTQAYFEVLRAKAVLRVATQTLDERDTLLHQVVVLT